MIHCAVIISSCMLIFFCPDSGLVCDENALYCIDMLLLLIVLLALGFRGIGRFELFQSEHLHHFGPWRLWSSRSSAATSSTTPQVAGRRRHQRRPISRRLSPHAATMPATAGPSTPASPSASCHPHPRRGLHGPAPPPSPRHRNTSSFTMGKKRSRAISVSPSTSPPSRPELWAGPGFCNSPPPSSLPIPKFSLHQKRSVSLEFPPADRSDDEEVPVHAKSAPSSPTAGSGATFFSGTDATIATENLRRILHLKIEDD
jgi:hypothetical protein